MWGRNLLRAMLRPFKHEPMPDIRLLESAPEMRKIVIATDADDTDPGKCHWRGYLGPYVAWGSVNDCASVLFARALGKVKFDGIRIITGDEAKDWIEQHGDPLRTRMKPFA